MKLNDVCLAVTRKEDFGGIVYLPTYNAQLAVNDDLCQLVTIIKKGNSKDEAVRLLSQTYAIDDAAAEKLLTECLTLLSENLDYCIKDNDGLIDPGVLNGNTPIRLSAPLMLIIEVSNSCNLKCSFCCQAPEVNRGKGIDLPRNVLDRVLDEAQEIGVFKIHFIGGEPLCRRDFSDILSLASQKGFFVSFTTNGILIDKFVDDLQQLERLLPIQISVHGNSGEAVRGKDRGESP